MRFALCPPPPKKNENPPKICLFEILLPTLSTFYISDEENNFRTAMNGFLDTDDDETVPLAKLKKGKTKGNEVTPSRSHHTKKKMKKSKHPPPKDTEMESKEKAEEYASEIMEDVEEETSKEAASKEDTSKEDEESMDVEEAPVSDSKMEEDLQPSKEEINSQGGAEDSQMADVDDKEKGEASETAMEVDDNVDDTKEPSDIKPTVEEGNQDDSQTTSEGPGEPSEATQKDGEHDEVKKADDLEAVKPSETTDDKKGDATVCHEDRVDEKTSSEQIIEASKPDESVSEEKGSEAKEEESSAAVEKHQDSEGSSNPPPETSVSGNAEKITEMDMESDSTDSNLEEVMPDSPYNKSCTMMLAKLTKAANESVDRVKKIPYRDMKMPDIDISALLQNYPRTFYKVIPYKSRLEGLLERRMRMEVENQETLKVQQQKYEKYVDLEKKKKELEDELKRVEAAKLKEAQKVKEERESNVAVKKEADTLKQEQVTTEVAKDLLQGEARSGQSDSDSKMLPHVRKVETVVGDSNKEAKKETDSDDVKSAPEQSEIRTDITDSSSLAMDVVAVDKSDNQDGDDVGKKEKLGDDTESRLEDGEASTGANDNVDNSKEKAVSASEGQRDDGMSVVPTVDIEMKDAESDVSQNKESSQNSTQEGLATMSESLVTDLKTEDARELPNDAGHSDDSQSGLKSSEECVVNNVEALHSLEAMDSGSSSTTDATVSELPTKHTGSHGDRDKATANEVEEHSQERDDSGEMKKEANDKQSDSTTLSKSDSPVNEKLKSNVSSTSDQKEVSDSVLPSVQQEASLCSSDQEMGSQGMKSSTAAAKVIPANTDPEVSQSNTDPERVTAGSDQNNVPTVTGTEDCPHETVQEITSECSHRQDNPGEAAQGMDHSDQLEGVSLGDQSMEDGDTPMDTDVKSRCNEMDESSSSEVTPTEKTSNETRRAEGGADEGDNKTSTDITEKAVTSTPSITTDDVTALESHSDVSEMTDSNVTSLKGDSKSSEQSNSIDKMQIIYYNDKSCVKESDGTSDSQIPKVAQPESKTIISKYQDDAIATIEDHSVTSDEKFTVTKEVEEGSIMGQETDTFLSSKVEVDEKIRDISSVAKSHPVSVESSTENHVDEADDGGSEVDEVKGGIQSVIQPVDDEENSTDKVIVSNDLSNSASVEDEDSAMISEDDDADVGMESSMSDAEDILSKSLVLSGVSPEKEDNGSFVSLENVEEEEGPQVNCNTHNSNFLELPEAVKELDRRKEVTGELCSDSGSNIVQNEGESSAVNHSEPETENLKTQNLHDGEGSTLTSHSNLDNTVSFSKESFPEQSKVPSLVNRDGLDQSLNKSNQSELPLSSNQVETVEEESIEQGQTAPKSELSVPKSELSGPEGQKVHTASDDTKAESAGVKMEPVNEKRPDGTLDAPKSSLSVEDMKEQTLQSNSNIKEGDNPSSKAAATSVIEKPVDTCPVLRMSHDDISKAILRKLDSVNHQLAEKIDRPVERKLKGRVRLSGGIGKKKVQKKVVKPLPICYMFTTRSRQKSIMILPPQELRRLCRRGGFFDVKEGFHYNTKNVGHFWPLPSPRPTFKLCWRYRLQTVKSLSGIALLLRVLWCCMRWEDMNLKPSAFTSKTYSTDVEVITQTVIKKRDIPPTGLVSEFLFRKTIKPIVVDEDDWRGESINNS